MSAWLLSCSLCCHILSCTLGVQDLVNELMGVAGEFELGDLKVLYNPNHSVVLWSVPEEGRRWNVGLRR